MPLLTITHTPSTQTATGTPKDLSDTLRDWFYSSPNHIQYAAEHLGDLLHDDPHGEYTTRISQYLSITVNN